MNTFDVHVWILYAGHLTKHELKKEIRQFVRKLEGAEAGKINIEEKDIDVDSVQIVEAQTERK